MNGSQDNAYIATPGGMITYANASGGGAGGAVLASPGHSPTTLASIDLSTPDLSSLASSPGGPAPEINSLGAGTIEQASGLSNVADMHVPVPQADQFWENDQETGVRHSSLQDGFQTKAKPWSMDAEAYFTMELAHSQMDRLVTTAQALGSI